MHRVERQILFTDRPYPYRAYAYYLGEFALVLVIFAVKILGRLYTEDKAIADLLEVLDLIVVKACIAVLLITLPAAVYQHVKILRTTFLATDTEAEVKWRVLDVRSQRVQLAAVKEVTVSRNLWQMALGVGDIVLRDTTGGTLTFFDLGDPEEKRNHLWDLISDSGYRMSALYEK